MEIAEAQALIKPAFKSKPQRALWADLGGGSGTFTSALATLLGEDSRIYAVDKDQQHLLTTISSVKIHFVQSDFATATLPFHNLDGILMANVLHYVKDKIVFMKKLIDHLKSDGQIIIVEYDTETPNQWVPYPVKFDSLANTFSSQFTTIQKIGERKSIYKSGKMYACSLKRR